ncbi:MAG: glycosyltransferase family 2 protein [Protaetiibacter sp.]
MTRARVSVALCTRNGARFLTEQLESILAQTVPVTEIVISDDASDDDTVAVAERVLAAHPDPARRDTILHNSPALGVAANFEQALAACTGDYLALSDQDDVWHPERVERALAVLEQPGVLAVHTDARLVDAAGRPLGSSLLTALEVSEADLRRIEQGQALDVFIRRNLATGATMTIRAELLPLARPFPSAWVHDEWLAIVAALVGGLRVDRRELIDYRQHGANEIGVREPSLRYKLRRVLVEPRGDRNRLLAARAEQARDRLGSLLEVSPEARGLVVEKAEFERARAALHATRALRVVPVLRLARRGRYDRLSSRGRADVVRDILQPDSER